MYNVQQQQAVVHIEDNAEIAAATGTGVALIQRFQEGMFQSGAVLFADERACARWMLRPNQPQRATADAYNKNATDCYLKMKSKKRNKKGSGIREVNEDQTEGKEKKKRRTRLQ